MPYLPTIDTTHALRLHPTCLSFAPYSHIFFVAALEFFKIIVTFAVANAKRKIGRVIECAGLEIQYTSFGVSGV